MAPPENLTLPSTKNLTESRALSLLGSGVPAESVASALGVSPGRISQLLSNKEFSEQVASLRYGHLQKHNNRDASYDTIEDKLIKKLEGQLPLLMRPMDTVKALTAVNGAKRRGQSAPDHVTNQQNIVALVLPNAIIKKFTTNVVNQVVKAGDQDLVTMPAGNLLAMTEKKLEGLEHTATVEGNV